VNYELGITNNELRVQKSWRKVRLGDILTESKIESTKPSTATRIRVLLNAKGVIKRPVKKETKGATKYFIRNKGQFIYGKQNIHKGAFGIVPEDLDGFESTSDLPAFDVDKSCLPIWIDYFLKQGNFYLSLLNIARGAATKRVQPKELLELKIPLPSLEEQQKIVAHFKSIETEDGELKDELTHQQTLLKKLRQQILQEAIEGKLTADWRAQNPDVEPASELLARIQAEKQQLIKDKKIKKQKPLPAISEEEKPFALPDEWVWCRVNDIASIGTGATPLTSEPNYYGGEINWMTSGDTSYDYVTHTKATITEKAITETNCQVYPRGTLVVAMYGQGKTRGQVTELKIDAATNQACVAIQLYLLSIEANQFLKTHFKKIYNEIRELAQGGAQPNLNMGKIKANIIALPPLSEQKAIVAKVEKLLALCDQLETQITHNQNHANALMQAVLKEAFTQTTEQTKPVAANA